MFGDENVVERFRTIETVPKYLLQGSLFPATKTAKATKKEKLIKTFDGKEIYVCHEGFTQVDLAVSLAFKKVIVNHNKFDNISFSMSEFAAALGKKDGGKTRGIIREAFRKSNNFHLGFDFDNGSFDGYRLKSFKELGDNNFEMSFNMDYLETAYSDNEVCEIDLDVFSSLQLGLQSWLYGFICTIPDHNELTVDALYEYSGANYKNMSDFKKAVKEALGALQKKDVIDWRYGIERNGVVFWQLNHKY